MGGGKAGLSLDLRLEYEASVLSFQGRRGLFASMLDNLTMPNDEFHRKIERKRL